MSEGTSPESRADRKTRELIGRLRDDRYGGVILGEYLGRGASALVFRSEVGGNPFAVKVFDPMFLEEFPRDVESERIKRQLDLRDKPHENLVRIRDGGTSERSGIPYLAMEYYDAPTLDRVIGEVPQANIRRLVSHIAAAAKHLEDCGWTHRDIKPANIVVTKDFERAILLDLGVVRPFGLSDLTDSTETKSFVGTTRYSPPEFLLRTEDGTPSGWRAVTFYQIGAVLADLLTGRPIFHDKNPKGRLYYAIFLETADLSTVEANHDLVRLARLCLQKRPEERLASLTWEMFDAEFAPPTLTELKAKIASLRAARAKAISGITAVSGSGSARDVLESFALKLKDDILADGTTFPHHSYELNEECLSVVFTLDASREHQLSAPIHVEIRLVAARMAAE